MLKFTMKHDQGKRRNLDILNLQCTNKFFIPVVVVVPKPWELGKRVCKQAHHQLRSINSLWNNFIVRRSLCFHNVRQHPLQISGNDHQWRGSRIHLFHPRPIPITPRRYQYKCRERNRSLNLQQFTSPSRSLPSVTSTELYTSPFPMLWTQN